MGEIESKIVGSRMSILGKIFCIMRQGCNYFIKKYYKSQLLQCGSDVYLGNYGIATYSNISIGNHVYIGSNYVLQSLHGQIKIGNHVMFGPGVHIHGGNHIYDHIGEYMDTVHKEKGSDGTVVIEDDVWIGANAVILGSIRIGFGSIIGAGAVVTKDVPEGCICVGNPARIIKARFTPEELERHKTILNGLEK